MLVHHETTDGVATLTLDSPHNRNALSKQLVSELFERLKRAEGDDTVKVVLVKAEGRTFCSGADLRGGAAERDFRRVLTAEYNPLVRAMRDLPKPLIAAVNGVAAGAGVSIALACDLVYASQEARFILAFARIGLVPDSGSTRTLVRALGRHRATQLIFSGEPLGAAEAHAAGLVTRVVEPDRLRAEAGAAAAALAAGPTQALGLAKRLINQAEEQTLDESLAAEAALQELAGRSQDHAEGVAAFGEKREPRFVGR